MSATVYVIIGIIALVLFTLWLVYYQQKTISKTQRIVTDRELLRMIARQADGFLTAQQLAEATELSVNDGRTRLQALVYNGLLKSGYNNRGRLFYELRQPLEEKPPIALSEEPFLTVEDILALFVAHNYRLDYQGLILATGLPLDVLQREMKYFTEQKMVNMVHQSKGTDGVPYTLFLLEEPYRSDPDLFRNKDVETNLKLKELLRNDQLI